MKFVNVIKRRLIHNPSNDDLLDQTKENSINMTYTVDSKATDRIAKINQSIENRTNHQSNIPKSYNTYTNNDLISKKGNVATRVAELNQEIISKNNPNSVSERIAAINARLATRK